MKLATFCFNTQRQTLPKIPQLFRRQSVPPPLQRLLRCLRILRRQRILVGLSTGIRLQNWPTAVIHRVEIRRVRRPFLRCDDVMKMGLAPLLCRSRSVGWSGIFLKCPLLSAKVAMGPRNHHSVEDVTAVNALVNFYPSSTKTKGVLPVTQIPAQTITEFGFWRCSTIADMLGASALQLLSFWWLWACSVVNSFSSANRIRYKFWGMMRQRSCWHLSSGTRLSAVRSWTL